MRFAAEFPIKFERFTEFYLNLGSLMNYKDKYMIEIYSKTLDKLRIFLYFLSN